jgi:hypothetical protein
MSFVNRLPSVLVTQAKRALSLPAPIWREGS